MYNVYDRGTGLTVWELKSIKLFPIIMYSEVPVVNIFVIYISGDAVLWVISLPTYMLLQTKRQPLGGEWD